MPSTVFPHKTETEACVSDKAPIVPIPDTRDSPSGHTKTNSQHRGRPRGQNPSVRIRGRGNAPRYYFFQYWVDTPGEQQRKRQTEVIGLVNQMTRHEAELRKIEFMLRLERSNYQAVSAPIFADAIRHYRTIFAPRMLRESTISTAESRLTNHLERDWNDVPIGHITIDAINEWAWRKREAGLSWGTIKDALGTMQRLLSAFSKDKKPPFSQRGLEIPERDKLQMQIRRRKHVSYDWAQALQIAEYIRTSDLLGPRRRIQYATLMLLAAGSGLRSSELLALRLNDLDFAGNTIRVDESSDQRNRGAIGDCKNAAAYRTVVLHDFEGRHAMHALRWFVAGRTDPNALVFRSYSGKPLLSTTILRDGLHPTIKHLGLPRAGMHAFRRGCNRRWELAGIAPAVIRQQMGHTSYRMTTLYSGEIPVEQVAAAFANRLEKMETATAL